MDLLDVIKQLDGVRGQEQAKFFPVLECAGFVSCRTELRSPWRKHIYRISYRCFMDSFWPFGTVSLVVFFLVLF